MNEKTIFIKISGKKSNLSITLPLRICEKAKLEKGDYLVATPLREGMLLEKVHLVRQEKTKKQILPLSERTQEENYLNNKEQL